MSRISLNFATLINDYSLKQLKDLISKADGEISIDIPLDSIGFTQSHYEISIDLLFAFYIADSISSYCKITSASTIYKPSRNVTYWVNIKLQQILEKNVAGVLLELSKNFDYENGSTDEFKQAAFDSYDKLKSGQFSRQLANIAEDCEGNYSIGQLEIYDEEEIKEICEKNPEQMFGFWKSVQSNFFGKNFYVDFDSTIILPRKKNEYCESREKKTINPDIPNLLQMLIERDELIHFFPVTYIQTNNLKFIFNKSGFFEFPSENCIANARNCAQILQNEIPSPKFCYTYIEDISEFYLSESGEFLVLCDNLADYLFFNMKKMPRETIEKSLNFIGGAVELLKPSDIEIDWKGISDEKFEELCYAIISQSEKYDIEKIQRMGKARSRDGGRDLIVESRKFLSYSPTKTHIIQCKLITTGISLTGKKVTDIVDTIERYGATGYCIMTNVVIDSTLYDKLNDIGKRRNIEIDSWSKDEIEWFLLRRPDIRKKYFRTSRRRN